MNCQIGSKVLRLRSLTIGASLIFSAMPADLSGTFELSIYPKPKIGNFEEIDMLLESNQDERDIALQPLVWLLVAGLVSIFFMFSSTANAALLTSSSTDGDATIDLSIEDVLLDGVSQEWGSIRVDVNGFLVPLSFGDTVILNLYDLDSGADDLLWSDNLSVTSAEVFSGSVSRLFPMIFSASYDDNNPADTILEIYAEAIVEKSACTFGCVNDNPVTQALLVNVAPVPVPAATWLFASALALLGWLKRRRVNCASRVTFARRMRLAAGIAGRH